MIESWTSLQCADLHCIRVVSKYFRRIDWVLLLPTILRMDLPSTRVLDLSYARILTFLWGAWLGRYMCTGLVMVPGSA